MPVTDTPTETKKARNTGSSALSALPTLTLALRESWLTRFRHLVATAARERPGNGAPLRLRDWTLSLEDGRLTCTLYLDRGQSWLGYDDFSNDPRHKDNLETVSVEDCLAVHKRLLASPELLASWPDEMNFEVSSAGEEPPLHDPEDFAAAVGLMVALAFWDGGSEPMTRRAASRGALVGRLLSIGPKPGGDHEICLDIMPNRPVSPKQTKGPVGVPSDRRVFRLGDVSRASLLLFDPRNFAKS